jgi:hypothetical protein
MKSISPHFAMVGEVMANGIKACTGQVAGAGKADDESTPSATCQ